MITNKTIAAIAIKIEYFASKSLILVSIAFLLKVSESCFTVLAKLFIESKLFSLSSIKLIFSFIIE